MALSKSGIEYLTHSWNFMTGCRNQENGVCNLPCWARAMAKRFHRSFEPELHPEFIDAPLAATHKPRNIGVCFTGDLFGNWVNPDMQISPSKKLGIPFPTVSLSSHVIYIVRHLWIDRFFFLTKCPWNLQKWGKFPDNAWVGASCTDEKTYAYNLTCLIGADAKNKWLSIEPLLGRIDTMLLKNTLPAIQWLVIGAQTHPNVYPKIEWVREIVEAADKTGVKVFLKNNLKPMLPEEPPFYDVCDEDPAMSLKLRQELPV